MGTTLTVDEAATPVAGESAPQEAAQTGRAQQPAAKRGPLLDEPDEEKAFRLAKKLWERNKRWHHRNAAVWLQNRMWRDGERFLKIVEDPGTGQIRIAQPLGTALIPPVPNACDSKIRANIAIFLADPPRPECEPWDDTPQARVAAQFATRVLTLEAGEAGLNTDAVFAAALDIAATYASSFTYVSVDPKGGGLQPRSVQAHPDAQREEEAEAGPPDAAPKAPVPRYVMPDGSLSETSAGAMMEWVPKLRLSQMTGNHLRFLPRTATGVDDAHGVVFATWDTLGSLKARYERVRRMSEDELGALVRWRIDEWKRLVPDGMDVDTFAADQKSTATDSGAPDNDALVQTLHVYYKSHYEYPYGAYACFGGGKYRLYARDWTARSPDAKGGEGTEMLDLPVAQMRWWTDAQGGNPYGKAPAAKLGPMDEIRAAQYAAAQEYTFRFSRPRPYLPMGTTVQPEDLADLDKPIMVPPNGQPYFPPIPEFPQMAMQLVDRIEAEMDDELSVPDAARGVAAGSVRSAEQQKAIIEQGLAGTSVVRAAAEDYYERLHRLVLQQMRAFYPNPRMMRYQGDGGAWQIRDWSNVDLGATREVRVRRGTFTLQAPTAKAGLIGEEMAAGMITPYEAMRLKRENMAPLIGLSENPHAERVKRQLWLWRQGPTPDQRAAPPAQQPVMDPATGQPAVDPMTGQPQMQQIDPLVEMATVLFAPIPVDADPTVALIRYQELGGASADAEQHGFPPGWVQGLYQAAEVARQAAGVVTIAEQQQAQAQQQAAEQQAQQAQQQAQQQDRESERAERAESQAAKQDAELQREAIRAGSRASGSMPIM